jgi:hypothetical protein
VTLLNFSAIATADLCPLEMFDHQEDIASVVAFRALPERGRGNAHVLRAKGECVSLLNQSAGRAPHGMCSTLKNEINTELLAFFHG